MKTRVFYGDVTNRFYLVTKEPLRVGKLLTFLYRIENDCYANIITELEFKACGLTFIGWL